MMRCTECGTAEDVLDRVYLVSNTSADGSGPGAMLGPLRMCEGCWEWRRASFRAQVAAERGDWRARVATVRPPHADTLGEGRRLGGDAGMRL